MMPVSSSRRVFVYALDKNAWGGKIKGIFGEFTETEIWN